MTRTGCSGWPTRAVARLHLSCGAALFNLRLAIADRPGPSRWSGRFPTRGRSPRSSRPCSLPRGARPTLGRAGTVREHLAAAHQPGPVLRPARPAPGVQRPWSGRPAPSSRCCGRCRTIDAARVLAARRRRRAGSWPKTSTTGWSCAGWIGTDGDDGVPAAALGSRPDREPGSRPRPGARLAERRRCPLRATSYGRTSRCWPRPATIRPTGSGPARRCSGCCSPRPCNGRRRLVPLPADRAARHASA